MSRHRFIKTIDVDDELDEFEGDDDEGEYYDYNDDPKMRECLAEAREVLGSEFTDREIQDSLWYTYYDVEKTVNYLLNKKSKPTKTSTPAAQRQKQLANRRIQERRLAALPLRVASAKDCFADCPWLNVPLERQALITVEPMHPHGGLLGGSSKDAPKTSKLAALAAARKKKSSEASSPNSKSPSSPAALLDKLSKPKLSEVHVPGSSSIRAEPNPQSKLRPPKYPIAQDPTFPKLSSNEGTQPERPKSAMLRREDMVQKIGTPSTFAVTMLGSSQGVDDSWTLPNNYDPFQLTCDMSEANSNPFAGPSPDDVVAKAQSASKSLNSKSQSKAPGSKLSEVENVSNGLHQTSISEVSRQPPKSKNLNVLEEYKKSTKKHNVNFVVIGHVDAGKSTLMGRLLWDLKVVDQRTIDKYRKESERIGKSSFALAWVLDQSTDEREHGVTIDIAMNKFETEQTAFTILDAPGHKDFVANMIAGASQADFAILVLDASTGSFESGLKGQTKEHAMLVRSMGVQRLIVAVNKLDTVAWSKERYEEVTQQTSAFLAAAGFQSSNVSFVPCSGLNGENIVSKSSSCSWYNGPTLLSLLESSEPTAQKKTLTGSLRIPISQIFNAGVQHPLSVAGRATSGSVQIGEKITIVPSGQTGYVKAISVDDAPTDWAVAGQNVTLHLSSDVDAVHIKGGDVVCPANTPLQLRRKFTLKVLAFEHLMPTFCNVVVGRLDAPAKVTRLLSTLDKSTGKVVEGKGKRPRVVKPGEVARVEVTADAEGGLPIEEGTRVVLRAEGETVATGLVEGF